jgi:hypothetical protein
LRENLKPLELNINENNYENNFPNKSSLIINSILTCLEDENILVRRNILDFLYQSLRINLEILSHDDKLVLVEGVLYLFLKKDLSVIRRINVWLLGKPDFDNKHVITEENEFVIDLIV